MNTTFTKWQSIENFRAYYKTLVHVFSHVNKTPPVFTFRGKEKIHGTNAGFNVFPNGSIRPFKRSGWVSVGDDNAGFAAWCVAHLSKFLLPDHGRDFIVYGEWAGQGIQKGVAHAECPKSFYVFSILDGERLIVNPTEIESLLQVVMNFTDEEAGHSRVYVLPWHTDDVVIDFGDPLAVKSAIEVLDSLTDVAATSSASAREYHDINGPSEGLVFYTLDGTNLFKSKSEKFDTVKKSSPNAVDYEKINNLNEFAKVLVTDARLEQGFSEVFPNGNPSMKDTGAFIRWIANDVLKECEGEIAASDYDWKAINPYVAKRASNYLRDKVNEI